MPRAPPVTIITLSICYLRRGWGSLRRLLFWLRGRKLSRLGARYLQWRLALGLRRAQRARVVRHDHGRWHVLDNAHVVHEMRSLAEAGGGQQDVLLVVQRHAPAH